jgi:TorA maturation chaperone TorD
VTNSADTAGAAAVGSALDAESRWGSLAATATRADVCRLLAACYYQPDRAFVEERIFASMAVACACIRPDLGVLAETLDAAFAREPLDELLIDYTRLFVGPVDMRAAPYASAWLRTQKSSPISPVVELYERAGFELADDFSDLPDHIAVEIEFLYALLFRSAEATFNGDLTALAQYRELERIFLADHLCAWMPRFASAVRQNAQSQFYRILADITEAFVAGELHGLERPSV